jgi:conjugative transposon TraN protein
MKQIVAIMITGIILLLISPTAFSQTSGGKIETTIIEPYSLKITLNKTTNLIFPYGITSVDRGSADVLVQKAKGVENILLVKAGKENFLETNLSVITADGKLYSFILEYVKDPSVMNISFVEDSIISERSDFRKRGYDLAAFQKDKKGILSDKIRIRGVRDNKYEVDFRLNGIYIMNDIMFFKLEVINNSTINYDVDMLKFFIKDEKRSNRTASQEIEKQPLYVHGDTSTILANSTGILLFALSKFTIPDKKYLSVQMMEKNGGRNLQLVIRNKKIIKAQPLINLE